MDNPDPIHPFDAGHPVLPIRWSKALESGHPLIDRQHRQLFDIGNQVVAAVRTHEPRFIVEALLQGLIERIEEHFTTEEAVLARSGHPLSLEHQRAHDALLIRAGELLERYRENLVQAGELVGFINYDVILSHIVKEDTKFAQGPDSLTP